MRKPKAESRNKTKSEIRNPKAESRKPTCIAACGFAAFAKPQAAIPEVVRISDFGFCLISDFAFAFIRISDLPLFGFTFPLVPRR